MGTKTVLAASLALAIFAHGAGAPIFSDDFEDASTFAKNWVRIGGSGAATATGRAVLEGATLQMRRDTPADFHGSVDITFQSDRDPAGNSRAGFRCENAEYTISPHGRVFGWFGAAIEGFEIGKPVRIELVRRCRAQSAEYVFLVNGETISRRTTALPVELMMLADQKAAQTADVAGFLGMEEAEPAEGSATPQALLAANPGVKLKPLQIMAYGTVLEVDNFQLSLPEQVDDSPNLVINSSFEHARDGFPLYYGRQAGVFDFSRATEIPFEHFLDAWKLDTEEKYSGRQSLRITFDDTMGGQALWAWGAGTVKDLPGVFSVWMKADRERLPVTISYGTSKEVLVGTSWQRYEVVNPKLPAPDVYSPVTIALRKVRGTVWIDDLQAEISPVDGKRLLAGKRAFATPYKPSELDKLKFGRPARPARATAKAKPSPASGGPAAERGAVAGESPHVSMLSRLNYYMNEEQAVFRVRTTPAEGATAVLTVAGRSMEAPVSPEFKIAIPLKDIPEGTNTAVLVIRKNGATVGEASAELVKRPYRKGAVQINRFTRSLIHDGAPVFPFMPLFVFGKTDPRERVTGTIDFAYVHGFKYVHILVDNHAVEPSLWAFERMLEKGIRAVLWTKQQDLSDGEAAELRTRFDFPNILAQMVLDEPEIAMPSDDAMAFLRSMRSRYPYHPVFMNNTFIGIPNRYANLETDILMIDDYLTNREKRTVASVVEQADIMRIAGEAEGKPCFFALVCGNTPHHHREPSSGEQVAQTYGTIAAGCTGLMYFYGVPATRGNWDAYLQLNKEILALSDVLLSEEEIAPSAVSADPKTLRTLTRKHNGHVYVISCNIDEGDAGRVTFTLPGGYEYAGEGEVLFEDRTVKVAGNQFDDQFAGHARHVYRVKIVNHGG